MWNAKIVKKANKKKLKNKASYIKKIIEKIKHEIYTICTYLYTGIITQECCSNCAKFVIQRC